MRPDAVIQAHGYGLKNLQGLPGESRAQPDGIKNIKTNVLTKQAALEDARNSHQLKEVALEQAKSGFEQRASLLTNLSDDVSSTICYV